MKIVKYTHGNIIYYIYDEYLELAKKSPYFEKLAKNPDPNTANLDLLQYSHFVINDSTNKILKCRNILQNIFDNFLLEDKDET